MYYCDKCGALSEEGQSQIVKIEKKRQKTYTNYKGKVSQGWEIEKQIKICVKCNKKQSDKIPDQL